MESRLLIAGFGGQGVMLIGQLLGYASCKAGKYVTYLPSYGAEQRGGTANCTVIISDKEIGSPAAASLDVLIAMNEPSLVRFLPLVKPGGVVLVNSSVIELKVDRTDVQTYYIPANQIAEGLGTAKVANIVMLGAYLNKTGLLTLEQIQETIQMKLARKASLFETNKAALRKGVEATS